MLGLTRTTGRVLAQTATRQSQRCLFTVPATQRRAVWAAIPVSRRWNSDAQQEQPKTEQAKTEKPATEVSVEELQKQLAEQTKTAAAFKDKYLRALAEAQNLDNRRNREVQEARQHALFKFAGDLVSTVDLLLLAQKNAPKAVAENTSDPNHSYYQGVGMVFSSLLKTLKQHNVNQIDVVEGETDFNAHLHDCIAHTPHPTVAKNKIIEQSSAGWKLNDRVVRAAAVVVSSGPPPSA